MMGQIKKILCFNRHKYCSIVQHFLAMRCNVTLWSLFQFVNTVISVQQNIFTFPMSDVYALANDSCCAKRIPFQRALEINPLGVALIYVLHKRYQKRVHSLTKVYKCRCWRHWEVFFFFVLMSKSPDLLLATRTAHRYCLHWELNEKITTGKSL